MKFNISNIVAGIDKKATLKAGTGVSGSFESDVPMFSATQGDTAMVSETDKETVSKQIEEQLRDEMTDGKPLDAVDAERVDETIATMAPGIEAATVAYFAGKGSSGLSGYAHRQNRFGPVTNAENMVGFSTGIESFDVQNFDDYHEQTVKFNLYATQQSPFAALFAPILVGNATMNDWKLSIDRVVFGHFAEHTLDKSIVDAQRIKPLQSAYSDIHALKNNATDLVPFVNAKSEASFVSSDLETPTLADLDGVQFNTSSMLADGRDKELLALSQHPGRTEAYTRNAQIHKQVKLQSLTVKVASADGSTEEAFRFKTLSMPRVNFNGWGQGNSQEPILSFRNDNFKIGAKAVSKTAKNADSALLKTYIDNGNSIRLKLTANGSVKLDRGQVNIQGTAEIVGLYTQEGDAVEVPAELKALKLTLEGFSVKARTTNTDLAHISLIADMVTETDICRIGLRPPIVAHRSLMKGTEQSLNDEQKLNVLIEMTKVSMANDALLSFIDYFDTVNEYCKQRNSDDLDEDLGDIYEPDAIAGIGRKVLRPECIDLPPINLSEVVNSLTSADKITDVRRYVAGVISDTVSSLIQNTRILTATPIYAPTSKIMGKVVTSPRIESFLMLEGDPRLTANNPYEVVSDPATVLTDTFYVQLSIDNPKQGEFNVLNSGHCLYIPPLVGTFPVRRGSSTVEELAVQGQWEHVYNVPGLARIKIEGLTDFIREKTRLESLTEIANEKIKMETVNP